jgi:hypothetical protein
LYLAGQLQTNTRQPRGFDREVGALARRHPADKRDVIVLLRADRVIVEHNAVMDDVRARHRLAPRLCLADRDVLDGGVLRIQIRQHRLVRMMQGRDHRHVDERRERNGDRIVEVQHIGVHPGIVDGPRRVVGALQLCGRRLDRPLRVTVPPPELAGYSRVAVRVHDHVMPTRL